MIKVGAATEIEIKERKHRIEDAISATKAAVEEGIIPGGGAALIHAGGGARRRPRPDRRRGDRRRDRPQGAREPLRWIAPNAGLDGYVVVGKVAELRAGATGFNAATDEYGDLMADGIVDPVKVTRNAVANAASIAGLLLTTESAVVDARGARGRRPVATATSTDRQRPSVSAHVSSDRQH